MNVTGTIYSLIYEADGDIHIRLTVDSPFTYMLNASNYSGELGKLVCEPICATTVTQSDAISSCAGFTNTVYIPNVGEHVAVTGPYVTDNDHGWNELHPVTSIVILYPTGIREATSNVMDGFKVYPTPSDDQINMEFATAPGRPVYITIYDALGRSGGNYQLQNTTKLTITTTYLPDGTYYYSMRQDSGVIGQGEFAVRHAR
ncbi:unnamed protein product [Sphagnum balticum]